MLCGLPPRGDDRDGPLGECREDIVGLEAGSSGAEPSFSARAPEHHRERVLFGWLDGEVVVLDERIRHHVQRGTDPEILIEPERVGAVGDRLGVVDVPVLLQRLDVEFGHLLARQLDPVHPQVPLADTRRVIASSLQHLGHGQPVLLNQSRTQPTEYAALQLRAPRIPPGHHAVPRRRTNARAAVGIGKRHPLFGDLVQARRGDLAVRIEALHIAVPEVIAQDEHNVRTRESLRRKQGRAHCEEQREQ